jgi:hypothetical protein
MPLPYTAAARVNSAYQRRGVFGSIERLRCWRVDIFCARSGAEHLRWADLSRRIAECWDNCSPSRKSRGIKSGNASLPRGVSRLRWYSSSWLAHAAYAHCLRQRQLTAAQHCGKHRGRLVWRGMLSGAALARRGINASRRKRAAAPALRAGVNLARTRTAA